MAGASYVLALEVHGAVAVEVVHTTVLGVARTTAGEVVRTLVAEVAHTHTLVGQLAYILAATVLQGRECTQETTTLLGIEQVP